MWKSLLELFQGFVRGQGIDLREDGARMAL
jgi:hypothetical protein